MTKLKVGIAGYGIVGKRRRKFIDEHPAFETVAVSDVKFADDVREADGVRAYQDFRPLLEEKLDVLFVCLPNDVAPEATMLGLERGMHVFCEKPPGRTVEDVKKVMAVEARHPDLVLKYGFNHRYHDSVVEALKIIKSGEMGEVVNMEGVYGKSRIVPFEGGWRSERKYAGGGILIDQGIHLLDLMRLFSGDFKEVKSFISDDFWHHDVEDNAFAIMKDEKGRIASIHSSATIWEHLFSLNIFLTKGFIKLSGLVTGSKTYGEETLTTGLRVEWDKGTMRTETTKYLEDNSWKLEIDEFADAVTKRAPVRYGTSNDALETMKLVYRIYYADPAWRAKYNIPNPDA
jgi:predicted dehydrogenase